MNEIGMKDNATMLSAVSPQLVGHRRRLSIAPGLLGTSPLRQQKEQESSEE